MKKQINLTDLTFALSVISLTPLHADVLFTFQEVGDDVVATTSGTIASGWSNNFTGVYNAESNRGALESDGLRGESGGSLYYSTAGFWDFTNRMIGIPTNLNGVASGDTFESARSI